MQISIECESGNHEACSYGEYDDLVCDCPCHKKLKKSNSKPTCHNCGSTSLEKQPGVSNIFICKNCFSTVLITTKNKKACDCTVFDKNACFIDVNGVYCTKCGGIINDSDEDI